MNESISTAAGAQYGQLMAPSEMRRWIRDLNRTPAQRDTTYRLLKVFKGEEEEVSPLDQVEDADKKFGSYGALTASKQFRYAHPGQNRNVE